MAELFQSSSISSTDSGLLWPQNHSVPATVMFQGKCFPSKAQTRRLQIIGKELQNVLVFPRAELEAVRANGLRGQKRSLRKHLIRTF